ncbi:MAG: twin-arginine translocation signal domain-containing protein, partial [Planctomycetes bacterium]|nr:twin-arginine translocation signal domain-containing protein [Planctomycetota bacterium]
MTDNILMHMDGTSEKVSRRNFLLRASATCASAVCLSPWFRRSESFGAETPAIEIVDPPRVISWKPPLYHGWPTLARRKNGELILVWSGGRESHVCPFGRVELMRSHDHGKTWTWPQVLLDSPID